MKLVGWSGHRFIYLVIRSYENNFDKRIALKSYDAESGKLSIIDETQSVNANGQAGSEAIDSAYIVNDKVVYGKAWSYGSGVDKKSAIMSINADGSSKQRIKEFSMQNYTYIQAKVYEPNELYFAVSIDGTANYFEYDDGSVKSASINDGDFNQKFYPTYLFSPSSKRTLWHEPRDGKNTIFVGNSSGDDARTIASLSEFASYGWFSDDYILLSKNGSELYIATADKSITDVTPLKVTDYHKPTLTYPGYGYGYGGI